MNVQSLHDLFVWDVQRAYGIERQLAAEIERLVADVDVDALDDLRELELREELTTLLREHRAETETHADRLADVLGRLDARPEAQSAPALDGLVQEKEQFTNVVLNDEVRPAYFLGVARRIEQLETSIYEDALDVADHLPLDEDVLQPIEQNLEEDRAVLDRLDALRESAEADRLLEGVAATEGGD